MAELTYIQNDAEREETYKKGVKKLFKKTKKLSEDSEVEACTIVYSPYSTDPQVWPPSRAKATEVLKKFKESPDMAPTRNFTQETFLRERVTMYNEKVMLTNRRNIKNDMENVMLDLLAGRPVEQVPVGNVDDLTLLIEDRMRTMQDRIRAMEATANNNNPALIPFNPLGN